MSPAPQNPSWPRLLTLSPSEPLKFATAALAIGFIVVIVLDLTPLAGEPVGIWALTFGNGGPIEWVQWSFLGLLTIAATFLAARLQSHFFYLFGFVGALLLIEDAGDPRHRLSVYVSAAVGDDLLSLPTSTVVELLYFVALASVPLYAFWNYRDEVWPNRTARRYLLWGYGLYAVAAPASATRRLGGYEAMGRLVDDALGGRLPMGPYEQGEGHVQFIDGVVEESIELLAAACLLGMVLACAREARTTSGQHIDEIADGSDG